MEIADLVAIRAVLGQAYADDPLTRWVFGDAASRADACAAWYGLFVEAYAASGRITWLPDDQAVCLWRDVDGPQLQWPTLPSVAGLLAALVGEERAQVVGDALHPVASVMPTQPHVYVNFLAVAPSRQGCGAGERALRPAIDAARTSGVSVHLESTNPRNLPFYERLGFAQTASLPLGTGPTLIALALTP